MAEIAEGEKSGTGKSGVVGTEEQSRWDVVYKLKVENTYNREREREGERTI